MRIPKPIAPAPYPLWKLPGIAANSNVELTALDAAKRLGWRGIVGAEVAAEGIGATLWGIARIGLPILTLGLMMEGDESPKPLRLRDLPPVQPDPKLLDELDLTFLKQQRTLAELSGNTALAQIFDIHIRGIEATRVAPKISLQPTGQMQIVASSGGDSSTPMRKSAALDVDQLSPDNLQLWRTLTSRLAISPRGLYRYLAAQKFPIDHPLLATLLTHHADTSGAEHAIAWYRMLRQMDHAPQYATMFNGVLHLSPDAIVKDIPQNHMPWLWDALLATVSRHRDPITRRYALEITHYAMGYASHQMATFQAIVEAGLQDPEPSNVWFAWRTLNQYLPHQAQLVDSRDLAPEAQLTVASSPEFGLAKYVHGSQVELRTRHEIYLRIFDNCEITLGEVSWLQLRPIHSLADFNPDPGERRSTVTHKQSDLLALLIEWHGDHTNALSEFLIGPPGQEPDAAKVMILPSGRSYLIQGHHRMAALIHMALEGQLPMAWLDHLPVQIMRYHGEIPEVIVRRVLTLGIDLEWVDLFPQTHF